jgi:hypothetical protein
MSWDWQAEQFIEKAVRMAKEYPEGLDYCERGNSIIGSLLSMQDRVPRQYAEQYCREAKRRLAAGKRKK